MFEEEKRTDNKPFDLEVGAWINTEHSTSDSMDLLPWEKGEYSIASFITTSKNVFTNPLFAFKNLKKAHILRALSYSLIVLCFQVFAILLLGRWMSIGDTHSSLNPHTQYFYPAHLDKYILFMFPKTIFTFFNFIPAILLFHLPIQLVERKTYSISITIKCYAYATLCSSFSIFPFWFATEAGSYISWSWFLHAFSSSNKISIFKVYLIGNLGYILFKIILHLSGVDALNYTL